MHDTDEWQDALETNGWTDDFATGEEFEDFLDEQDDRVADDPRGAGTGMSTTTTTDGTEPGARAASSTRRSTASPRSSSSSAATSSTTPSALEHGVRRPAGPALRVPLRGRRRPGRCSASCWPSPPPAATAPEAEEGEDIDLTEQRRLAAPSALLVGVFVVNIAADRLARLGDHRRAALRRLPPGCSAAGRTSATSLIGAALSVGTWYGFYVGLGIPIPAGILDGVL